MIALAATQEVPAYLDAAVLLPDVFAQLSVEDFEFERGDARSSACRLVAPYARVGAAAGLVG